MKKITIINHKGGVGKTTTAINIGAGLSLKGSKVLLIDLDPQTNLTNGLGVKEDDSNIYNALINGDSLLTTKVSENLYLAAGSLRLADAESELFSKMAREQRLKKVLDKQDTFDYCIIDCPPSLNQLTINALVSSDYILIPMKAEYFSLTALSSIMNIYNAIQENFNSRLSVLGIFLNDYDKRKSLSKEVALEVKRSYGDILLTNYIRSNVSLSESATPPNCTSIFNYDKTSNGASDYNNLIKEIIKKINSNG